MDVITEKDWQLFKKRLPEWQERHIAELNEEYIKILSANEDASEKFWKLEQRINQDKKSAGVITALRRNNVYYCLAELLGTGIITKKELEGFSTLLVDALTFRF